MQNEPLIEGENPLNDLSYKWLQKSDDIKLIEQGIPILKFEKDVMKRNLEIEYKLLKKMTETSLHEHTLKQFTPALNKLNRYGTIIPCKNNINSIYKTDEHSLVEIKPEDVEQDSEEKHYYINASWTSTCIGQDKAFIATQGPLPNSFTNFWKMIWQYDIQYIIMLCNFKENEKSQCDQYWPKEVGQEEVYLSNIVKFEEESIILGSLIRRTFKLYRKDSNYSKTVLQYQMIKWQDHNTPSDEEFPVIKYLIDIMIDGLQNDKISVIHCSAGIGRTGTLIALTNIILTLEYFYPKIHEYSQNKCTNSIIIKFKKAENLDELNDCRISIFGIVRRLREQRYGGVHTGDQYKYLYKHTIKEIQMMIKQIFN